MADAQIDFLTPPPEELTWKAVLGEERQKPYFRELMSFVEGERAAGKTIFPRNADVFNALSFTPLSDVKIVILGQDPYHGPNQAHGLCFSVQEGIPFPPSLKNIFQELNTDLGVGQPQHGCLDGWAKQGVLLLNAVLTVQAHNAGSHAGKGWEVFTDAVIKAVNDHCDGVVFLLWGSYAQKKAGFVDRARHTVLESPHPSPLSAHRGFFGCKHFSQANAALERHERTPIDWSKTRP